MRVAVVGGGIAGLAAAWEGVRAGHDVVLIEGAPRWGGKIRMSPFAGMAVDEGADAFITRSPEARLLCEEIGLHDLVAPATGTAYLWIGDGLRKIPEGTVLGVPADLDAVAAAGVLSAAGLARAGQEPTLPGLPLTADVSIGSLIRARFGDEVADYLVDPLLGGINAGGIDNLSLDVAAAQIAAVARSHTSLLQGLTELKAAAPASSSGAAPVFQAPAGGMGQLVEALVEALAGAGVDLRGDCAVDGLDRSGRGWQLTTSRGSIGADAVVVATPAHIAGQLIGPACPAVAAELTRVEHASVALITLAYPAASLAHLPPGSGVLVPKPERRLLTAVSWFSNKWARLGGGKTAIVRVSAGRLGDRRALDLADDDLVAAVHAELSAGMGIATAPSLARVSRWESAFPQFAPGHLDRVVAWEAALASDGGGLALAGSYLRGVGIPACIGGGRAALRRATGAD